MAEKTSYPIYQKDYVAAEHYLEKDKKRTRCVICDYQIDERDDSIFSEFNCNIRAFQKEAFKVWRCPKCKTIHTVLDSAPFDYILLQDVIEHVEDPRKLLSKLDGLLAPGGYIPIGTPNAANLDLTKPSVSDFYNSVHVPYHFHIYTDEVLKYLGNCQNWQAIEFRSRAYHDTPWLGVNTRAWNQYQQISDGSLDAIHEPIDLRKAVTSYKVMFYAFFGYWLSYHTEMSMMFRKI